MLSLLGGTLAAAGALAAATSPQQVPAVIYTDATFSVRNTTNISYAQGLVCADGTFPGKACSPVDLLLDVYEPVAKARDGGGAPVPALKPAYILSHGGGNSGGEKEQWCVQGAANFYAARGLVAFNIDYRLAGQKGLLPPATPDPAGTLGWTPAWQSAYPAVRDLKAAIRFVKANAEKFGVDPNRVVVSGGSAGTASHSRPHM